MKKLLFFISFTIFILGVSAQELKPRHLKTLEFLEIKTDKYDLNDLRTQIDFNKIIILSRRKRINKGIAITITSISAVPILIGASLIGASTLFTNANNTGRWLVPTGAITASVGLIAGSTSIPFYVMYSRNMKERKLLLNTYNKF